MLICVYLIGALIAAAFVHNIIVSVKCKRWLSVLASAFALLWVLWFAVSVTVGGSAFHHAATDYAGFQEGHYYLVSHSVYTEVSYEVFQRMEIFEVAAMISFAVSAVCAVVEGVLNRKKNKEQHI